MRAHCLAIALMLFAVSSSDSWGQSARQPSKQESKSPQQNSTPDNRGTEQAPIVVKILPAEQTKEKPDDTKNKASEHWFDGWSLSDKIAVVASIVAFLQFIALIATVYVMRRTAQRQLRAYVFVDTVYVSNVAEGDGIPEAHVAIKNFGQTPAYKFVNITGFAIDNYPPPAAIELTVPNSEFNELITRTNLGPTQSEVSITNWGPGKRVISDGERKALADGKRIIFVYGEIRYVDAFGNPKWTKYRFMIGGPVGIRGNGQMAGCPEGNDAI
jgi:hypothetical protein